MSRAAWIPLALILGLAPRTWGQDNHVDLRRDPAPRHTISTATSGVVNATPDMWFYEQERSRHDDPKLAVRRRAEQKANERHDRLAALEWYGLSNSRPTVSPNPFYGSYSAYWGANNYDPFRWRTAAGPLVIRPDGGGY